MRLVQLGIGQYIAQFTILVSTYQVVGGNIHLPQHVESQTRCDDEQDVREHLYRSVCPDSQSTRNYPHNNSTDREEEDKCQRS